MERAAVLGRLTWQAGRVVEIIHETPRATSLIVDLPEWSGHLAGQHVDIRLTAEDGYQAVRSYSITTPPEERLVGVTVERLDDGEVSPYLSEEVRPGDFLEFRGPIGGYFVWTAAMGGPLLLVAGGSGIAPLMAMLRHRVAMASDVPVRLLYSARSPEEIIFRTELDHLAATQMGMEVIYTFTRTAAADWTGYRRRIDPGILAEVSWPAEERQLSYVCGPTSFVESVSGALLALGHDASRIRTERFGPTGG